MLLIVAAAAVVAIGVSGAGLVLPPAELDDGGARSIRFAGAFAAAAGLIALLVQRGRQHRPTRARGPDPTGVALRTAATIMVALALLALLTPSARIESDPAGDATAATGRATINPDAAPPADPPPPVPGATMTEGSSPVDDGLGSEEGTTPQIDARSPGGVDEGFDWSILRKAGNILLLILIFAVVVVSVLALTGRLPGRRAPEPPPEVPGAAEAEEAEAGLQASLSEVASDSRDPRRQITAAYRRLLSALGTVGAPRQPQEAPHEHLHRALGPLGVRPEPLHRLTELYVEAQFSERPITERHRAAAAEALEASLENLRATASVRVTAGADAAGPLPGGAGA